MSERLTDSSLPLGRNLDLENTNILPEVLKLHSGHFQHRIISGLITSKDNLPTSLELITSEDNLQDCLRLSNLRAQPGFYAQTTYLTSYARTPSFERSRFGQQTGASLLLSTSYKKASQINQIKQQFSKETYYLPNSKWQHIFPRLYSVPTQDCFLLHQEVLFLSMALPSQSKST